MWQAVVLGIVQGLTEFLPVSSSAHLRIVGELIGSSDPGAAFTAITQIGTEAAVVLYFRRDIVRIISAWWRAIRGDRGTTWAGRMGKATPDRPADHDARMGWFIAFGSVPIVFLGLLLQKSIEHAFRNLYLIALMLVVFGIILGWTDRHGRKTKEIEELTLRDALYFGLAQALAIVPGVSRSGGTISMGLLLGYTRKAAARYSFLLAIPAVLGSGFYELAKSFTADAAPGSESLGAIVVATLVAFVIGYVVIIGFLRLISQHSFEGFVVYRILAAVVVIILLVANVLQPLPVTG